MIKIENSIKGAAILENPISTTQINMIVDGCKVNMNFPQKSDGAAISDIKRMMLGGAVKT